MLLLRPQATLAVMLNRRQSSFTARSLGSSSSRHTLDVVDAVETAADAGGAAGAAAGEARALLPQQPGSHSDPGNSAGPSGRHAVLEHINESTKWGVSALVFAILVWRHDKHVAWCVLGSILGSFICKVLKHAINERRPPAARKKDPGMPSSHANSLGFLSVYAATGLMHLQPLPVWAPAMAAAAIAGGTFLTWLRVALGFHTVEQVLAGGLLGAGAAGAWFALGGAGGALAALSSWAPGLPLLYGLTGAAMLAFALKNVLSWHQERRERLAAALA